MTAGAGELPARRREPDAGRRTRGAGAGPTSGLEIRSPWQDLTVANARRVEAAVGVYELRSSSGVVRIDYAGARSRLGLRGELLALATAGAAEGLQFRSEVVTTYLTRWAELLGLHLARHGQLPRDNVDHHPRGLRPLGPRR